MVMHEPSDAEVEALISTHPQGCTYEEIGDVLGVTKVRAQQIVNAAVAKVLRALRNRNIYRADDAVPHTHYSHRTTDSLYS